MTLATLVWGAWGWLPAVVAMAVAFIALLAGGYSRAEAVSPGVRVTLVLLKATGIAILLLCLLEPLFSSERARPGANQFVILADNSQSMSLKDANGRARGEELKALVKKDSPWLAKLGLDFDLREFSFDSQLKAVDAFETLKFDGHSSDLGEALDRLVKRYQGRPLAGILLLTDGSATDAEALEKVIAKKSAGKDAVPFPPIYPVVIGSQTTASDVSVDRVDVTQTNFEDAPVTLAAQIITSGLRGKTVVAELQDENGKSVEQIKLPVEEDGQPLVARFRVRPEKPGLSFYKVRAAVEGQMAQFDHPETSTEATLANNSRLAAVDRGKGPYRVLYVGGRPGWEFKYMNRALQEDDQVQLVAYMRVAKREPKFNFLGRPGDMANPLFHAFGADEETEQYDQPVMIRLNTQDETELKGGFPKAAEDLFKYHAIIIDRMESEFFNQDQMQLIKDFVRQRGGGLLMLGGQETFKNGNYDKTPIGDLLPVYADQVTPFPENSTFHLALTREGWLEPWLRLRPEQEADEKRILEMPAFTILNGVRGIKPGATVLARVVTQDGNVVPALVEQHFGKGRAGALLIGDMWKWEMHRPVDTESDFDKSWRQTIRWLVSDVPQRVEVVMSQQKNEDDTEGMLRLGVQVRDAAYSPLDTATVNLVVTTPGGKKIELPAEASSKQPGLYETTFVPRDSGAYRVQATAKGQDGVEVGQAIAGWATDPAADEFRQLQPNLGLLDRIAHSTGGQVVRGEELASFAASLPTKQAQIMEPFVQPFWHQSWVFLLALMLLAAEWGLRRWKGLP